MTYRRHVHTCNLVTQQSGDREIVIVGGNDYKRPDDCRIHREVEIINVDTKAIRNGEFLSFKSTCIFFGMQLKFCSNTGTDFPMGITRHTSVDYKDSFLILGGIGADNCTGCSCTDKKFRDTIFEWVIINDCIKAQIHATFSFRYNLNNDTWTEWDITLPRKNRHFSAMFMCPEECELCADTSTTGNCGVLDILAISDISLVGDMCTAGIGIAPFCEKTCDNILGGFCPWGIIMID